MTETLNIHIPVQLKRRNGRKMIVTPEGTAIPLKPKKLPPQHDDPLTRALIRAWRWQNWLRSGKFDTAEGLAERERVSASYVWLIMRLNFLAPDIKKAILSGRQPKHWRLKDFLKPFPDVWEEQRQRFYVFKTGEESELLPH